jgi:hypothetical protein
MIKKFIIGTFFAVVKNKNNIKKKVTNEKKLTNTETMMEIADLKNSLT